VSSIAPNEIEALVRAAVLAVGEDRDPVCLRDALWLAATMHAAEYGLGDQPQPRIYTGRRRRRPV
jgi:hypothetical protein